MTDPNGPSHLGTAKSLKHGFSEEGLVEKPTIELFVSLGWQTATLLHEWSGAASSEGRGSKRDVVLPNRLWAALRRVNPDLADDAFIQAAEELTRDRSRMPAAEANREVHRLLLDGVRVRVPDEHGTPVDRTVRLIDWREPAANEFFLGSQVWVAGELYTRRADLIGFVNGIPLVFLELKGVHKHLKNAYDENLSDYRVTIPQAFHPNGLVVLSNGSKTRIGSTTAPWEHFHEWKRINDEDEQGVVSLETAIRAICAPDRLLDLVENFTVFQDVRGGLIKIAAQNHQFLGVNKALANVSSLGENRGRLGVFWHTQGSGKSLSMVFFCQKLLGTAPGNWTFVIVTDRDELDRQIYKTFATTGAVTVSEEACHACSAAHLRELLRGNNRYVFTLIHKFRTERGEPHPVLSERDDIIVITDEAHRSQYDTLALNMRTALPNAAFLGFTGTPLMTVGEERTREVFGDYVSVYNFARSIEDGATVPLYYENRIPELQLARDDLDERMEELLDQAALEEDEERKLAREFARTYQLITRDDRLERIAEDIVEHFTGRGYRGKAMAIAIDKATAVRMYDKVNAHWERRLAELRSSLAGLADQERAAAEQLIAEMETTDMAVIVSQAQNEIADLAAKGLDMKPHRKRMVTEDLDEKFKDPDDRLRLVFVCAMWITGFDVPTCSTIYLDKPMRNHTLMQTIARANRNAPGKLAGLIVDYIGVFRDLQKALAIYAARTGGADRPIVDKQALADELRGRIAATWAWLHDRGVELAAILRAQGFERTRLIGEAVEAILAEPEDKKAFLEAANRVAKLYKAVLPDPVANSLAPDAILIAFLAKTIRAQTEPPDVSEVIGEVERLLDDAVAARGFEIPEGSEPKPLVNLSEIDFEALAAKFAASRARRTEAEVLKAEVAQKVRQLVQANPSRVSWQDKLEELIGDYNAGSKTIEAFFQELLDFARGLTEEEQRHIREGLTEEELALFDILTKPEPTLTKAEEAVVKRVCKAFLETLKAEKLVLDWRNKPAARADVQTFIRDALDSLPEVYDRRIYGEKCDLTYQHIFERFLGPQVRASC